MGSDRDCSRLTGQPEMEWRSRLTADDEVDDFVTIAGGDAQAEVAE
jgi:hypothetical protein